MTYGDYPDLTNVKKVLVIKLRQLGDVLLTSPVFSVLKGALPDACIDAYVYTESFPLLEGHPALRELIGYDRGWKKLGLFSRLKKEIALWRQIRKEGYDLVINLTEGDRGTFASWASKAPIQVGFNPKGRIQKKLYTHVVKHCPSLRHTVERNLDALRRIGLFPREDERDLFLAVEVKSCVDGNYVVIHPTSRWRFKCLPIHTMRAVTEELIKRRKKVVFTSGPDPEELAMVHQIAQGLDVINLAGKIRLKELATLISKAEFLLCVDSLPFHMASALKKPVVAVFGPTSDVTWGPWRNPHARVVAQGMSCRPCYQDGCGGSKLSDCLFTLPTGKILQAIDSLRLPV